MTIDVEQLKSDLKDKDKLIKDQEVKISELDSKGTILNVLSSLNNLKPHNYIWLSYSKYPISMNLKIVFWLTLSYSSKS